MHRGGREGELGPESRYASLKRRELTLVGVGSFIACWMFLAYRHLGLAAGLAVGLVALGFIGAAFVAGRRARKAKAEGASREDPSAHG